MVIAQLQGGRLLNSDVVDFARDARAFSDSAPVWSRNQTAIRRNLHMVDRKKSRREVLATVTLGTGAMASGLTPSVLAQAADDAQLPVHLNQIRGLHRERLRGAARSLGDTPALSREGLYQSLTSLAEPPDLLNKVDRDVLEWMISALFEENQMKSLLGRVLEIYDQFAGQLGYVARTIVEIIVSSVEHAWEMLQGLNYDIVKLVIAHDVRGAIEGAAIGSALVVWPSPGARVASAVAGAVVAGTVASIIGYEDAKDREMRVLRKDSPG